ncbi:MAG TPA: hypothetical protein ENH82_01140 [bacterium]|nr:hypothetical protein [bacterium]
MKLNKCPKCGWKEVHISLGKSRLDPFGYMKFEYADVGIVWTSPWYSGYNHQERIDERIKTGRRINCKCAGGGGCDQKFWYHPPTDKAAGNVTVRSE